MSEQTGSPAELAARLAEVELAILARAPEHDIVPSLDRIRAVVELLGDPQRAYPVVHLTGTNGKTSTTRMVDELLRAFGMRTGRFTSPHLHSPRERISIEGKPISAEKFVAAYDDVAPYLELVDARGGHRLTFFETFVAMAYAAFADAPVDVAVVEVGMGGAWDATNVADGQVAVITPVAIDHTRYLGETEVEIAAEKSGIIKPGALAVLAQQDLDVAEVLMRKASEVGATVAREGLEFGVLSRQPAVGGQLVSLRGLGGDYEDLFLPLFGAHQAQNAAVALAAVEGFLGGGQGQLDIEAVRAGFAAVTSPGRLEVARRSPTVLLDAAHNPAGALATAEALRDSFTFSRLIGVLGVMGDKDARGLLEAFEPVLDEVVVTAARTERAMPVDELAALAVDVFGADRVEVTPELDAAIDTAVALAEQDTELGGVGVLVTGSIVTVAQARGLLGRTSA
ncbi:dihydrofolate synthase/folylpolyglutamate synthase [Motilibacter peucedani]|uniref:Dihydrofolate synthase/folylpolyglutamate synthase n=1 Tax=Motilibacter peucedani TaxID=598650 RepID=A0A420XNR0_9ACTN|nr:folylpolyglutamate synthase/dihydrofolate synthase family protein [Motilibacter peucedani]RKS73827.1 dihydrofolate synthase/folylpolyglutamate synthase [Motilibacter peucedani]